MPEGIDVADTERRMLSVEGVSAVHHIHIWAMSTTENALTAHVVVEDLAVMEQVKAELKRQLRACGIPHVTLEFETRSECCRDLGD